MKRLLTGAFVVGLAALFPSMSSAATGARVTPCTSDHVRYASNRSHALIAPCVAQAHHFVLETNYYQNASKVGGSALAAYPEVRLRYGFSNRLEFFMDGPSEIAKSGLKGRGIYVMQPVGYGATYDLARIHGVDFTVTAENRPPLQALANTYLIPLDDIHVSANWSGAGHRTYGAEFGILDYESVRRHNNHRATSMAAFSVTQPLNRSTYLTGEVNEQFRAMRGDGPQSAGILSLQHVVSNHFIFNIEAGSAFNAKSNSKPHYWGFGFIYH